MFHKGKVDICPLLQSWQENDTPRVIGHFVEATFGENCHNLPLNHAFADENPEYREIMRAWLTDPAHKQRVVEQLLMLSSLALPEFADWEGCIGYLFDLLIGTHDFQAA